MVFVHEHANSPIYFERRVRTSFSRVLGFLMALFIISAGGRGFGAWADWENNDSLTPDGIQNYIGFKAGASAIEHVRTKIEVADGRMRMFRRMYGNEKTWTTEQREHYQELSNRKQNYVSEYQKIALRYTDRTDVAQDLLIGQPTSANVIQ